MNITTQLSAGSTGATRPGVGVLWEKAQRGWPAESPLVQFPNPPLLLAFAGLLVGTLTEGSAHDYARATFYAALSTWGWLELTDGANWPRRLLGAAGIAYAVAAVADKL